MLNPHFFKFCEILKKHNIHICTLSTGLTLKRNAEQLLKWTDEVIVSLDGNEEVHDRIRNIPNAFQKLSDGVQFIKTIQPSFKITARTVIHKLNFRTWPVIIDSAKEMGLDSVMIKFLMAVLHGKWAASVVLDLNDTALKTGLQFSVMDKMVRDLIDKNYARINGRLDLFRLWIVLLHVKGVDFDIG